MAIWNTSTDFETKLMFPKRTIEDVLARCGVGYGVKTFTMKNTFTIYEGIFIHYPCYQNLLQTDITACIEDRHSKILTKEE